MKLAASPSRNTLLVSIQFATSRVLCLDSLFPKINKSQGKNLAELFWQVASRAPPPPPPAPSLSLPFSFKTQNIYNILLYCNMTGMHIIFTKYGEGHIISIKYHILILYRYIATIQYITILCSTLKQCVFSGPRHTTGHTVYNTV
jgi:hypothetical protein